MCKEENRQWLWVEQHWCASTLLLCICVRQAETLFLLWKVRQAGKTNFDRDRQKHCQRYGSKTVKPLTLLSKVRQAERQKRWRHSQGYDSQKGRNVDAIAKGTTAKKAETLTLAVPLAVVSTLTAPRWPLSTLLRQHWRCLSLAVQTVRINVNPWHYSQSRELTRINAALPTASACKLWCRAFSLSLSIQLR